VNKENQTTLMTCGRWHLGCHIAPFSRSFLTLFSNKNLFLPLRLAGRCKRLRDSFFSPFHASGLLVAVSLRLDFVLF
jgi:hypothetical protein